VLRTAAACARSARRVVQQDGVWRVRGFGVGGGQEPADVLDLGNSGTRRGCCAASWRATASPRS
jgi:3-phosphoshikimate 1-carboxyvinyltransferase